MAGLSAFGTVRLPSNKPDGRATVGTGTATAMVAAFRQDPLGTANAAVADGERTLASALAGFRQTTTEAALRGENVAAAQARGAGDVARVINGLKQQADVWLTTLTDLRAERIAAGAGKAEIANIDAAIEVVRRFKRKLELIMLYIACVLAGLPVPLDLALELRDLGVDIDVGYFTVDELTRQRGGRRRGVMVTAAGNVPGATPGAAGPASRPAVAEPSRAVAAAYAEQADWSARSTTHEPRAVLRA